MSILLFGLLSDSLLTLGLGEQVVVEVEILSGGRSRGKKEEFEIIRVRILDESGRTFIQEQLINEDDLKDTKIYISENVYVKGSDILVSIKEKNIKHLQKTKISISAYETSKG